MDATGTQGDGAIDAAIGVLRAHGARIGTTEGASFSIESPDICWIVASGAVDVFAVTAGEHAQHVRPARRWHVCRVGAGEALFGLQGATPLGDAGEPPEFLAVSGLGAQVRQVERASLPEAARRSPEAARVVRSLVEGWVRRVLAAAVGDAPPPGEVEVLVPGHDLELAPGRTAAVNGDDVVWLRAVTGTVRVRGASEPHGERFLPLAAPATVSAEGQETARLQVVSTASYLEEDGESLSGLDRLHSMVEPMLAHRSLMERQARERRVLQRRENDEEVATRALSRLGDVTRRRDHRPGPSAPSTGVPDALLAACGEVGSASGVRVRRPHHPVSERKVDPVEQIARASGVRVRPVTLRDGWWRQDAGPLLGFRSPDHRPVALLPRPGLLAAGRDRYEVVDPDRGARERVREQVAPSIERQAWTFYTPLPHRALRKRDLFAFLMRGLRADLLGVLMMGIASGLLGALVPIATQRIVETVIPQADGGLVVVISVGLVIGAFAAMLFSVVSSFFVLRIETRLDASVQAAVWDRLLGLPTTFFTRYSAGDLAARATGINTIRQLVTGSTITTVLTGLFSVFSFAVVFYYSATLGLLAALMVVVIALVTVAGGYVQLRYARRTTQLQGEVASLMLQLLGGIAKLRVAGAEQRAFAVWAERYARQRENSVRSQTAGNVLLVFGSASGVLTSLVVFAFVAYGASTELDTSDFVAFNAAFAQFLVSAAGITTSLTTVLRAAPYYERARPILQARPEVEGDKPDPGELAGRVVVSHVSFRYDADGPLVLDDVSLRADPGEFVAIVGPSGAGKSSLLRVLLGFETPELGGVYYDDHDLSTVDVRAVRHQMGVVLQDGKLMPGPIFSNIVGVAPLTMDDAWEAARLVGLGRDIEAMPMGMLTILGEGATTISGGQRQRLMIARAIARRPRIVLLDEATSALDNRTQSMVSDSLEKLQVTRIVIAHRLSTIVGADRIYVVDEGRVVQSGTYAELMSTPGEFRRLAERQIA